MKEKKRTDKTAIETILDWDYNPSEIEARADERPFTKKEKEIIEKCKF